ncbi:hypothetical protein DXG03_005331 [Asterophora parasitica]|uniref:Uncharacterized protein n=1 Tax=Asterophora parasitica TaxID=117018 RepID=A0A9P7KDY3_9AGAR|nr:hypothetical protein DXG03_005331 [Asterophora parasitica]
MVSPGIAYLVASLPSLTSPLIVVYFLTRLLHEYQSIDLPLWAVIASVLSSIPVAILLKVSFADFIDHRRAAALGAVLPPRVYDKWPAGIGLLLQSINNLKTGYPGQSARHQLQT